LLNNFPFRERIKQQTGVMDINGANQLTRSVLDQKFPMTGRHSEPAFTVEIDYCCPTEHASFTSP
jgi:hypothetical protein